MQNLKLNLMKLKNWGIAFTFVAATATNAATESATYTSESTFHSWSGFEKTDWIEQALGEAREKSIEECFGEGFASCAFLKSDYSKSVVSKFSHYRQPIDAWGNPIGYPVPVYYYEFTYIVETELFQGSHVREVFGFTGFNSAIEMNRMLRQQSSRGFKAKLKLATGVNGITEWKGRIILSSENQKSSVFGNEKLPISVAIWGLAEEFALKFNIGDQSLMARGKVSYTNRVFSTNCTVDALVFNDKGQLVGSLELND